MPEDPLADATIIDLEDREDSGRRVSSFGQYQGATEPTENEIGMEAYVVALEVPEKAEKAVERIQEIKDDSRYTEQHQQTLAREVGVEVVSEIREDEDALEDREAELDEAEAELRTRTIEPRDPADSAGQLLDKEIRDVLREMDAEDRSRFLLREAGPEVLEATLRVPAFLTGIRPDTHESLLERAVEERFADELQDLEQARRNLRAARRAIENSYQAVKEAVDGPIGVGAA